MIRAFEPDDVPGVLRLYRELFPAWVITERGILHWLASEPERARLACWVAVEDGEVVGWAQARLRWEFGGDPGDLFVGVRPELRRRGLGTGLYERAESHLAAAPRIYVESNGEEDARRFLMQRGFRDDRAERISVLDPRAVDLAHLARLEGEKASEGFQVLMLASVRERGPELHRLFEAVDEDAPHSEPLVSIAYDEWRNLILDAPDVDPEGSVVVLDAGGSPVSFSWLEVDREGARAMVAMTGTLREFRRRGLARLAKLTTIRWAAENGITAIYTGNDTENAAMLSLNDELGFEPRIVYQDYVKDLR